MLFAQLESLLSSSKLAFYDMVLDPDRLAALNFAVMRSLFCLQIYVITLQRNLRVTYFTGKKARNFCVL